MKRKAADVPKQLAADLAGRWQAGERLPALGRVASEQLKKQIAPVTVRGWIIKHLGGPDQFAVAAAQREQEHPRAKPQPPRTPRVKGEFVAPPDDSGVLVITAAPTSKGWKGAMRRVRGYAEDVLVSPEGTRFVRAQDSEPADLIADLTAKGLGKQRYVMEEKSRLARRARREERQVKHGEEQRERRAGFEPADSLKKTKQVRRKK